MDSYVFSRFRIDAGRRKFYDRDVEISLPDRAFDILKLLIEARPEIVSKDEIIESVWQGTAVEDNSVERAMVSIRKVLNDDARDPEWIKTIRGRGYLFVGEVQVDSTGAVPSSPSFFSSLTAIRSRAFLPIAVLVAILTGAIWASSGYLASIGKITLLADDFAGKQLNYDIWRVDGKRVRIVDGIARITVDEVDNGGVLTSRSIAINPNLPLSVKSRIKVSFNQSVDMNVDFIAAFGLRFGSSEFVGLKFANAEGEFCYPNNVVRTEGTYLVRGDGDVRKNRDHVTGLVGPRIEPIWDTWVEQELRYEPDQELLSYFVDGVKKGEFVVGRLPLDETGSVRLEIHPRGWWLHHAIEVDQVSITQERS